MKQALWTPSDKQIAEANITRFMKRVNTRYVTDIDTFGQLHQWSIDNPEAFWNELWGFANILGDKGGHILENKDKMPGCHLVFRFKAQFC